MDPYSSGGEDLVLKTRKPYTITKQRERWTEEEHNRFLEALKLYGRAWQRIEEHIGTKTAVQIRSHAQKFFTKLEKEALVKGVPIRQALDIEIPPPRPKRKPSNPYPRKTSSGTLSYQVAAKDGKPVTSVCSLHIGKHILDLEKEPLLEKHDDVNKLENAKSNQDEGNCTEHRPLFQEDHCASFSSANENSMSRPVSAINSCNSREFVPISEEVTNQDETKSYITVELGGNQKLDKHDRKQTFLENATSNTSNGNTHPSHEQLVHRRNLVKLTQPENVGALPTDDMPAAKNYPRHVPVHIVDGNLGMSAENVSPDIIYQEPTINHTGKGYGHTNLFTNPAASATTVHHNNSSRSSINQTLPPFAPLLNPVRENQDDYRSFLHISSTLSSLIVSSLLQNPAAHAAASFAATFWPCANMEASSGDCSAAGLPSGQLNSSAPTMTAIAAATVAAATAWWAANGLLPFCSPFLAGYTCSTPFAFTTSVDNNQARVVNYGRENSPPEGSLQEKRLDVGQSGALLEQQSASKSPSLSSSSESEGTGERKLEIGLGAAGTEQVVAVAELHDSSKTKIRKQIDRSSCGSNTTSSSEIETDALEKHEKVTAETKEPDMDYPSTDSNSRSRSSIGLNDSWKEVSEEGRLAFQALFSREVLPQSFSPPYHLNNNEQEKNYTEKFQKNVIEKNEIAMQLDLNRRLWLTCSSHQAVEKNAFALLGGEKSREEGLLAMGHGNVKPKAHRTGFKPYKRCSVEAKESSMASTGSPNDEKGPKRMRLEGDAST